MFSRNASHRIVGRQEEIHHLTQFVSNLIKSKQGGCVYLNGPPGTGKTAVASQTVQNLASLYKIPTAMINCVTLNQPKQIFSRLLESLTGRDDVGPDDALLGIGEHGRQSSTSMTVVIVDEIDSLVCKNQQVLYTLFELALKKKSKIILVGIANSLDLADRILPDLNAKCLCPDTLTFKPYSADQIAVILQTCLESLKFPANERGPIIEPAAIQLCARKVAAQTGDLRKAFDLCRRALDLVEQEVSRLVDRQPLEHLNHNLPTPPGSIHKGIGRTRLEVSLKAVTLAHMVRVTSAAFGGTIAHRLKALNIHQKAALCSISMMEKNNGCKSGVTSASVFKTYSKLCERDKLISALSSTEFHDVIGSLDDAGVVSVSTGGAGNKRSLQKDRKIAFNASRMDLLTAIGDIGFLKRFLIEA